MALPDWLETGNPLQCAEQFAPGASLAREDLASFGRESVVAALTLTGLLDPLAFDPATPFHPVQHRIQGGDVKPENAARAIVNQPGDFIAMAGAALDRGEDHELGAAAFDLSVWRHILADTISTTVRESKPDCAWAWTTGLAASSPGRRSRAARLPRTFSNPSGAAVTSYLAFVAVNSPPTFIGCTFTEPEIFSADSTVPL